MRALIILVVFILLFRRRKVEDKTELFALHREAEARRQRLIEARIEELEKSAFA